MSWVDVLFGTSAKLAKAQREAAEKRAAALAILDENDADSDVEIERLKAQGAEAVELRVGSARSTSRPPSLLDPEEV